ncbi:MAG: hypothetical protein GX478_01245 [Erysipelotrichaceae bacterium]|nr:hypothetical protein [Erysipelotrichaceae bacterium]
MDSFQAYAWTCNPIIINLFSSEELSAFDYGILCILLDTLDFLPVIILAFLLNHNVWIGAIFIVELSLLRQYSGGWHAKSIPYV